MRRVYFLLIVIALGVLQSAYLNYLGVFGVKPDLLLISMVIASFYFDWRWSLFFSISAGLFKDIAGVHIFGTNTVLFAAWNIVIIQLSKKIALDSFIMRTLLISLLAILNGVITRLILISSSSFISLGVFLRIILLDAIYTASVWPLVFKAVKPLLPP